MSNYKGKFIGLEGNEYEVLLISDSGDTGYTEVLLSTSNPFLVTYDTSKTPFDPVRTSTASINVVADHYLEDILSHKAQGTIVKLQEVSGNTRTTKWCGYLTPKIFDAGYEECYETFQLEAEDCIASLQYIDYENINLTHGAVTFQQILGQIVDKCGLLNGFYWTRSKMYGQSYITPKQLLISEKNFFSSDIDEPWKLSEVLKEICQYLGFTAIQWGTDLYLIDYQRLQDADQITARYHPQSNNYNQRSSNTTLAGIAYIDGESYRKNGATISFEPVYNKVTVKQNLYPVEHFLPSIFDDNLLENRLDPSSGTTAYTGEGFYASLPVAPLTTPGAFPSGGGWLLGMNQDYDYESDEYGKRDQDFTYRMRLYNHKYYEPVFTNYSGQTRTPTLSVMNSTAITTDYRGANIVDLGVVRNPYRNQQQQLVVPSKMDYTRYLCIFEWHSGLPAGSANAGKSYGDDKVVFRLKDGFVSDVLTGKDCFLVINYSLLFEKYKDRNYVNPEWTSQHVSQPWSKAGSYVNGSGRVQFRLKIGDKYWNGGDGEGGSWTTTNTTFRIKAEWDKKAKFFIGESEDYWNTDLSVLNNISWEDELNCSGYKIPLDGLDMTGGITFEIINPTKSVWGNSGSNSFKNYMMEYNAYCWIKDFTIDFVRKGKEGGTENDVIWENIINADSVQTFGDITLKITTDTDIAQPSYSTVCYRATDNSEVVPLTGVTEPNTSLDGDNPSGYPQAPEENIIMKYTRQYNKPCAKISLTVSDQIAPFQKLFGVDAFDDTQPFVQLGTEIDYYNARQTMVCIEKKRNDE